MIVDRSLRLRTERIGGVTWRTRSDVPTRWWGAILTSPEVRLADRTFHLKLSRSSTVARIPASAPGQPALVLRRVNYGRWRHRLKDLFRTSRAQRAFRAALALEQAGVPVARALAVGEVRRLRWPVRAYLLSLEVGDATTLGRYVTRPEGVARPVEQALAKLLGRLHGAGFTHGDLKHSNVLIDATGKPWLIDFDGVRAYRRQVPFRRAVRDLARLAVGIIEAGGRCPLPLAARFLRGYCAARGLSDWRGWYQATARRVSARRGARAADSAGRGARASQPSGVANSG